MQQWALSLWLSLYMHLSFAVWLSYEDLIHQPGSCSWPAYLICFIDHLLTQWSIYEGESSHLQRWRDHFKILVDCHVVEIYFRLIHSSSDTYGLLDCLFELYLIFNIFFFLPFFLHIHIHTYGIGVWVYQYHLYIWVLRCTFSILFFTCLGFLRISLSVQLALPVIWTLGVCIT